MIRIPNLQKQYKKHAKEYETLQKEIHHYLEKLKSLKNVDIHEISQRPNRKIKTWKSISNNYNKGKYKNLKNLFGLRDIAGVRITCHCESDLNQIKTVLSNELIKTKYAYTSKPADEPYKALHFIVGKKIKTAATVNRYIDCEIQIRTVLGNAWAIQSHKYVYKDGVPAASTEISSALSAINEGLESLWDIIKKETAKIKKE